MKKFSSLIAVSLAALAIAVVNVGAQDASAIAKSIDIGRQVQKSIRKLPYYEVYDHIDFTVEGGVVTLTGKVRNATNKDSAERVVKRIDGVTTVVNNIDVLPVGGFDDRIRRNLYASISNFAGLSRYLWHVNPEMRLIVERGHVTLEGSVYSQGDKDLAYIAARSVPGVFSVTNNLAVGSSRDQ